MFKILAINPGSTSTKIGVYYDEEAILIHTIRHQVEDLKEFKQISDQKEYRLKMILDVLDEKGINVNEFDAIVARGGLIDSLPCGGTYEINDKMLNDLKISKNGAHASNLGGLLAREISDDIGVKAYTVDPTVIDEMFDKARFSGCPELPRLSKSHFLNQKAVARRYAKEQGKNYEDFNLIVCHMGGGVSVGAHMKGKVVDVNNTLDGEGPFTPERAGTLPTGDLIKLCYSGKYTFEEMYSKAVGQAGLVAYCGTNSYRDVMEKAQTDSYTKLVVEAFVYDIAKYIGSMCTALKGDVDAIILTGGIAYNEETCKEIESYVKYIAPVIVYPGEDELLSLVQGTLRVLKGEEEIQKY